MQQCETDKYGNMQDTSCTTFVISITQMFFSVRVYFVCAAVSLFLIALNKLRSTNHPRGPTRSHAQYQSIETWARARETLYVRTYVRMYVCMYVCMYIHIYNVCIIIGSRTHHARMYRLEIVNKFHNTLLVDINKQSFINHFFIWLSH